MTNKQKNYKSPNIKASIDDDDDGDQSFNTFSNKKTDSKSKTPVLDTYSRDISRMAEEGRLDVVVGREREIERVCQILSRRRKNNPILIGEPGVGKSSIAEGLATRIAQKKVSRVLFNKRIVMLDLASMVSGTKYRGQFEERVKALMLELEKQPNVILFLDEIHTIIGAGSASGSLDASNMLKPALSRGEIQIIGATTLDEYRKHIEKDGALERRFQKVIIEPTTNEETLQILYNIKDRYESHHNVKYTDEAIKSCVELTSRYIADRFLPDKAIDALDEAGARVHISNIVVPKIITDIESSIVDIKEQKNQVIKSQKYEEAAKLRDVEKQLNASLEIERQKWEDESINNKQTVTEDNVAEVVSMMSGIPLQKVGSKETERLSKMFGEISSKVVGQDDAVKKVVRAIQRGRIGMKDPKRPVFSGILIGNSGVGKTELAKQIAKYLFDSEESLIRLDMSEYMEKISINRIIGSVAGYVGYDDSNILDTIRRKPYSVVLLDEIEKAHPDVTNLLLQMLDEGHITDSHGRRVSFKNCIILMTSNVGTRVIKDFGSGVGFNTSSRRSSADDYAKNILEKELKKKFAPEFINRLDEIIYFKDLGEDDIMKIVELELSKSISRSNEIGYPIEITAEMKNYLLKVGYDPNFGARPMKRAIQKHIDDVITDYIIEKNPPKNTNLVVDYNAESDDSLIVEKVKEKKKRITKKEEL